MVLVSSSKAERLTAGCLLSCIGGFLDIYTYLQRGEVFANAVTGNLVLLGLAVARLQWGSALKYLIAIVAYALGVGLAEIIKNRAVPIKKLSWQQFILIVECCCLLPVPFIPCGDGDFIVTSLIALVCALQVQTFRKVRGLPFASTMCTGNLRSGMESLANGFLHKEREEFNKAWHYGVIILCFILGAVAGAVLLQWSGRYIFLILPLGLLGVLLLISPCGE